MFLVVVVDQGVGIVLDDQLWLFQLFYCLYEGVVNVLFGSGLGFVFVKIVVDCYGGWIVVQSVLGLGFIFMLWLLCVVYCYDV